MNFDNYLNQWYTQRCACNPMPCEWDEKKSTEEEESKDTPVVITARTTVGCPSECVSSSVDVSIVSTAKQTVKIVWKDAVGIETDDGDGPYYVTEDLVEEQELEGSSDAPITYRYSGDFFDDRGVNNNRTTVGVIEITLSKDSNSEISIYETYTVEETVDHEECIWNEETQSDDCTTTSMQEPVTYSTNAAITISPETSQIVIKTV